MRKRDPAGKLYEAPFACFSLKRIRPRRDLNPSLSWKEVQLPGLNGVLAPLWKERLLRAHACNQPPPSPHQGPSRWGCSSTPIMPSRSLSSATKMLGAGKTRAILPHATPVLSGSRLADFCKAPHARRVPPRSCRGPAVPLAWLTVCECRLWLASMTAVSGTVSSSSTFPAGGFSIKAMPSARGKSPAPLAVPRQATPSGCERLRRLSTQEPPVRSRPSSGS